MRIRLCIPELRPASRNMIWKCCSESIITLPPTPLCFLFAKLSLNFQANFHSSFGTSYISCGTPGKSIPASPKPIISSPPNSDKCVIILPGSPPDPPGNSGTLMYTTQGRCLTCSKVRHVSDLAKSSNLEIS